MEVDEMNHLQRKPLEENKQLPSSSEQPEELDNGRGTVRDSSKSTGESVPISIERIVLDRIDIDKSTPLPEGWIIITHNSGMPCYYHKFTQVVTHGRPYQVIGTVREHQIPVSAIPCFYRQVMDKKHKELENQDSKCPMSDEEKRHFLEELSTGERLLTPEQHREYCQKRFKFKTTKITKSKHSFDKEGAIQQKKTDALLKHGDMDYEQLKRNNPPGAVLLQSTTGSIFIDWTPAQASSKSGSKKPHLLNPMGKTSVAVLNEVVQRLAKGSLVYDFEDTRSAATPYKAMAMLTIKTSILQELAGGCKEVLLVLSEIAVASTYQSPDVPSDCKKFEIGSGVGQNKKTARLVAAKNALLKLFPKLRMNEECVCEGLLGEEQKKNFQEESTQLMKEMKIECTNLTEICARFGIPKPFAILRDAVSRSLRWHGMHLEVNKGAVGNGSQLSRVILKLGDMEANAEAIGLKPAKELASQFLLKKMHPEFENYGSFLDLYGKLNDKAKNDEAKRQHDEVVRIQDTGNLLAPNYNVLKKLAEEMKRVQLHYPPKKFLYGLAPQASGIRETVIENPMLRFLPMAAMAPQYIPFPPPPPPPHHQQWPVYPPQQYYQHDSRKRGRSEDDYYENSRKRHPPY